MFVALWVFVGGDLPTPAAAVPIASGSSMLAIVTF